MINLFFLTLMITCLIHGHFRSSENGCHFTDQIFQLLLFEWMYFEAKCHWNLCLWEQLTTIQHWCRWWLGNGLTTIRFQRLWCQISDMHIYVIQHWWVKIKSLLYGIIDRCQLPWHQLSAFRRLFIGCNRIQKCCHLIYMQVIMLNLI